MKFFEDELRGECQDVLVAVAIAANEDGDASDFKKLSEAKLSWLSKDAAVTVAQFERLLSAMGDDDDCEGEEWASAFKSEKEIRTYCKNLLSDLVLAIEGV